MLENQELAEASYIHKCRSFLLPQTAFLYLAGIMPCPIRSSSMQVKFQASRICLPPRDPIIKPLQPGIPEYPVQCLLTYKFVRHNSVKKNPWTGFCIGVLLTNSHMVRSPQKVYHTFFERHYRAYPDLSCSQLPRIQVNLLLTLR